MRRNCRHSGFTLFELLVTIAIFSFLLALGAVQFSSQASRLFTSDLSAQLTQAKYEAVKRNGPVAVVWNDSFETFSTRFGDTRDVDFSPSPCTDTSATVIKTLEASLYKGLTITSSATGAGGLVWLPNGQRRNCDGTAAGVTTFTVDDGSNVRTLRIRAVGGIDIE